MPGEVARFLAGRIGLAVLLAVALAIAGGILLRELAAATRSVAAVG